MGKNNFSKCKDILERLRKKNEVIGYMELSNMIKMNIGTDPRTVYNSLRVMIETKLIKDIGNYHFKIR